jgi:pimeloyl-ACP methyl ester carboxylesterase
MSPQLPPVEIPKIADVLKHPAYHTSVWNLEPDRKGLTPVAEGRGGPIKISWEIHGVGPIKLLVRMVYLPTPPSLTHPVHSLTHSQFIMGLGSFKSAWQRQTLHFGHNHRDQYSVLVLDNRGMGESDKPLMRYSTSEMARDIAELLAHPDVGWIPSFPLPPSPDRTVHVVGISMGGMIAQELACLIGPAIASLGLICTAAQMERTHPFPEHLARRAALLVPKSPDRSVADAARNMFSRAWLASPTDDAVLPDPETTPKCLPAPKEANSDGKYLKFNTNAERFVAQEMMKRMDPNRGFTVKGFLLQLIACGWHRKTPEELTAMADAVGRERILIMHGTEDGMINLPHGKKLIETVKPAKGIIVEGMGHVPPVERCEWFNETIEELCKEGERLSGRA